MGAKVPSTPRNQHPTQGEKDEKVKKEACLTLDSRCGVPLDVEINLSIAAGPIMMILNVALNCQSGF